MANTLTLDAARVLLAKQVQPLPPVVLPLADATGCRLVDAIAANVDLPPADVSAMDGYAVRHADVTANQPLPVAFTIPAGSVAPGPLPGGAVARIFTGAVLPDGADTVIMQENAERGDDGNVRFSIVPDVGTAIRRRGEVATAGAPIAHSGDVLTPQLIGLVAAASGQPVRVWRRPTVAVLATGAELVPADAAPGPGQIRDSNSLMMAAFVQAAGLQLISRETVPDDAASLEAALARALERADIVVCTGGVSVGDHDLVPGAVTACGATTLIHGVHMKPGKPILVARHGGSAEAATRWIVGLPGNPVSAIAGWRLFAWPIARVLAGEPGAMTEPPIAATLTETVENSGDRLLLLPALASTDATDITVKPLWWKGSHDLATTGGSNSLLRVEPRSTARVGDRVTIYRL